MCFRLLYFSDQSIAAIHSHSNYINLVGMGEIIAVLNGVEFRTRHNDFKLRMPSPNSTEYGAAEDIPYPPVPPEVGCSLLRRIMMTGPSLPHSNHISSCQVRR